jgi:SAM-dependent methyltransferase
MAIEPRVAAHYAHGSLETAILRALAATGADLSALRPEQLAPVDEFHIGGRGATIAFAEQLGVESGMRLLDIGSGLGGASRYFATTYGCGVSGVDLTPEYVAVARALAVRLGLSQLVDYREASALDLPFEPGTFDVAYMMHVGMNITDKGRLFSEVRRVLRPQGRFGIYDVMRTGPGEIPYPVPWATTADLSFLETPLAYRQALEAAGFTVDAERDRRAFALEFFRDMQLGTEKAPPLGLPIVMGANAPAKRANMIASLEAGRLAPVEILARAS